MICRTHSSTGTRSSAQMLPDPRLFDALHVRVVIAWSRHACSVPILIWRAFYVFVFDASEVERVMYGCAGRVARIVAVIGRVDMALLPPN
jgi:hypothetical protein